MKKTLASLIIVLCLQGMTHAAGYSARACYWYYHNVSEAIPSNLDKIFILSSGPSFEWSKDIENPPSIATLDEPTDAAVDTWAEGYKKTTEADFDDWTDKEKALAKALFALSNQVRVLKGKAEISKVQFKTYLKDQM